MSTPIDAGVARRDTPGCAHVVHLNNAGAALPPQQVVAAVKAHLDLEAEIGGYEAAERRAASVEKVYDSVAALLGAHRDEIALVESATRAWDLAFYSLSFAPGDEILASEAEYASNYIAFLQVARRTGAVVRPVPSDATGQLDVAALERMITPRTKLVALTHVPTNGGLVNPAAAVGKVARAAGVPFLLDACQSAGQLPLDVAALGCDFLSATGRKYLRAPRGTGFLYVRKEMLPKVEPVLLDLHAATWTSRDAYTIRPDARRFEAWEAGVAARLGLGVAVDYALRLGLPAIRDAVYALGAKLRERLAAESGVTVRDAGAERCGIVTFEVAGRGAAEVKAALAAQRINVTVTTEYGTRLDMERRGLKELVRASVHYYNTPDELERLARAVAMLR